MSQPVHFLAAQTMRHMCRIQKKKVKVGTLRVRQLWERGWTQRLMERVLVKPDGYAQNPHVLTGRPMRLYRTDRVQAADALCLIADGIDIQILELDRQTLTRNTHEEYGMFMREHDHHKNEVAYPAGPCQEHGMGLGCLLLASGNSHGPVEAAAARAGQGDGELPAFGAGCEGDQPG